MLKSHAVEIIIIIIIIVVVVVVVVEESCSRTENKKRIWNKLEFEVTEYRILKK